MISSYIAYITAECRAQYIYFHTYSLLDNLSNSESTPDHVVSVPRAIRLWCTCIDRTFGTDSVGAIMRGE